MRQPEHIAIAGGGIIGLACALLLADRGRKVSLFEAGEAVREASWAAGGMLAVEDPENPAALLPFSRYSRALYPSFLEQIESISGHRVPFRTHQTVQIADPTRPTSAGTSLSRDEALSLIPGLADGHTYLLLEEASLDPRELCTALRSAAAAAGVTIYEHEPVLSVAAGGEAALLTTPQRVLQADAFVNCCGAWAASLHASAPVAPSKGQMLVVAQQAASPLTCVLRSPEVYLIPRGPFSNNDDGRIVIGATVEDAGYSKLVESAALSLLRSRAASLWPPAADAPDVESWAGLRPGTPDGLPFLGQIGGGDGGAPQFLAAGHHRNGILLAPGTAHVIADLVSGRTPAIDLAPFLPHRASPSTACDKHFAAAL